MERITRFRAGVLLLLFCLVAVLFAIKLYDLQIIETGGKIDNTATFTTRTRVKAARGNIMDCNGNAMVSNRASYDLIFNYYVITSADGTNDHLLKLVKLCRQIEVEYIDHFPVSREQPYLYTLSEYNSAWQGYFQSYLYNADLDSDITAPLLIRQLRKRYDIPADWSEEDARAVIGLRYELDLRGGITNLPNYVFIEDASDSELSAIKEQNIPGLMVEASTVREYNTQYAAHILGHTGSMNAKQWEHYKDVDGYAMDAVVGQSGLEEAFESYLHGVDGLREDVVTTDGTIVSSKYLIEPVAGKNVELTIDLKLQQVAEDELASHMQELYARKPDDKDETQDDDEEEYLIDGSDAEGASVVAIDVKTGKVLVCASFPTYNLATFSEDFNDLMEADFSPMVNRALMGTYPPGSTYKLSMVAAGITDGYINSKTEIEDKGVFELENGFEANCMAWTDYHQTHGKINASQALEVSCNYFFYVLGDMMRLESIDSMAKGLGLGEPTGIELPEYIGHRANRETKQELYTGADSLWYKGDQVLASIGQADNRFTPMQLCVYTAAVANQGKRYRATFLNRVVSTDYASLEYENHPELVNTVKINDEAYQTILEGMQLVCKSGTAASVFRNYPIPVAAKTGTAETGILGTSDNGSFVIFAPVDDPQIAVSVYGEKTGHGSLLAAIARSVLDKYFDVDEIGEVIVNENQIG